jgi:CDP-glucose 4,6-dehydratase
MIKSKVINLLLFAGSLLFALALVEIGLRIAGFSFYTFYTADPITGFSHPPNLEGWYREEGEAYIKINSQGLRDREHPIIKPENVVRIAILGDSYAQALQVPLEKTFWSVIEQKLNTCKPFGTQQTEVINFGVSSYGTAQELLTLRHKVWDYNPELILLALTTGNDIRNNSKYLESKDNRQVASMMPFFIYEDGKLVLDNSFVHSATYRRKNGFLWKSFETLSHYFRILQLLRKVRKDIAHRQMATHNDSAQNQEIGLDDQVYLPPVDIHWKKAWQVTEGLLLKMRDEIQHKNAKFLVVTLSSPIQVHPERAVREQFMQNLNINSLFYSDNRIKALGERENFEILIYSCYEINDFIICLGYKGYMVKEYFADYFLHTSDVTFDIANNKMKVHQNTAEPWRVTLVDTGEKTQTGGRLKRIQSYLNKNENFCFTYGDGVSNVDLSKLIQFHNQEGTLATLTATSPPGRFGALNSSYDNPVETYSTNVMGTVNVLEATRHSDTVKAVIIVTSDKCYKNQEWVWGYRENEPMGGHDPYSNSKGCAELVTEAYRHSYFDTERYPQHGVAVGSARAGNVIGGGDWAKDRLIPDIVNAFIEKRPVLIRHPNAIRPWQHVLEPLHGYLMLAERLWEKGPAFAEGWNFGPNEPDAKQVSYIVDHMAQLWGKEACWKNDASVHPHEANSLKLDCSKAKNRLNWQPKLSLKTALEWVIEWYQSYSQHEDMRKVTENKINRYHQNRDFA